MVDLVLRFCYMFVSCSTVVQAMTDETSKAEMQALRDRVANLEAGRDAPVKVEVEGFEGIRQLSHAIETQQLDRFVLRNSVPDKVFWRWFWAFAAICGLLIGMAIVEHIAGRPIFFL